MMPKGGSWLNITTYTYGTQPIICSIFIYLFIYFLLKNFLNLFTKNWDVTICTNQFLYDHDFLCPYEKLNWEHDNINHVHPFFYVFNINNWMQCYWRTRTFFFCFPRIVDLNSSIWQLWALVLGCGLPWSKKVTTWTQISQMKALRKDTKKFELWWVAWLLNLMPIFKIYLSKLLTNH